MLHATHWMIDCETLATSPDAVVLEFAFLRFGFTKNIEELGQTYRFDAAHQQEEWKRKIDPNTIKFWTKTNPKYLTELLSTENPKYFVDFFDSLESLIKEDHFIWMRGLNFDLSILEHMFRQCYRDRRTPWKYSAGRDVRTFLATAELFGWTNTIERKGTQHSAMDDCRYQIETVKDAHGFLMDRTRNKTLD